MDASDRDFLNTLDQELQSGEFVELEKLWDEENDQEYWVECDE